MSNCDTTFQHQRWRYLGDPVRCTMQGRKFTAAPPAALACTPVVFPAAGDGHYGAVVS
jgi:hypothetical protein